jgi:hypothetical protein
MGKSFSRSGEERHFELDSGLWIIGTVVHPFEEDSDIVPTHLFFVALQLCLPTVVAAFKRGKGDRISVLGHSAGPTVYGPFELAMSDGLMAYHRPVDNRRHFLFFLKLVDSSVNKWLVLINLV